MPREIKCPHCNKPIMIGAVREGEETRLVVEKVDAPDPVLTESDLIDEIFGGSNDGDGQDDQDDKEE